MSDMWSRFKKAGVEMSEAQEEVYNRMKLKFTVLAGYEPTDNSEIGIRLKVMASEIADIQTAIQDLKDGEPE